MTRILTFLAIFLVAAAAQAETVKEVSMNTIADNNIFGTSAPTSDYLTVASTYVANAFSGEGFDTRLFYQGSGYLFASEVNRSFTTQEIGIAHARKLGSGRNQLYAGASFLTRIDHTDYNVYDYAGMRAFLNGKVYVAPKTMLRAGYHLATRNYWNLDTASYADHYFFSQVTQFFPTKTTLRGDLSYSYKTHFSDEAQIVMGVQVAQSVRPGTGLSLRYQRRVNTLVSSADLTLDGFSLDEDILIDRYDYSGHQLTVKLTQQLPLCVTMVVSGGYETQTYDNQTKFDADSLSLSDLATRLDKITFGQVSLDIPVWSRLDLDIDYRIEKSLSNDAFYDYDGRRSFSFAVGLEF